MHRATSIGALALGLILAATGCTSILGGLSVGGEPGGADATTDGPESDASGDGDTSVPTPDGSTDSATADGGQGPDSSQANPDSGVTSADASQDTGAADAPHDTGVDAPPACGPTTCPNGCCSGGPTGSCVPFTLQNQTTCGNGGATCQGCSTGSTCTSGACSCSGSTSCSGCCSSGTCVAVGDESPTQCGANGVQCGGCAQGQTCDTTSGDSTAGQCICNASTCPHGCCVGGVTGTCLAWASQSGSQCGTAGATCGGCANNLCDTTTGTCGCDAVSCAGGCCNGGESGTCEAYASQSPSSCGANGIACASCGSQVCSATGSCVACTSSGQCTSPDNACCSGGCTDTLTDPNNCGGCGTQCTGGMTCQGASGCQCPAGTTNCGGTCVNLQTDSSYCGSCTRNCLGGACNAGVCGPVTLVSYSNGTQPSQMAVDATKVYWSSLGGTHPTGAVYSCGQGGCATPFTVAGGLNQPYSMVIDTNNVYFAEQPTSTVEQTPKVGGQITTFASVPTNSYPWGLAILGNHLFVEENGLATTEELTVPGGLNPTTILAAGNPFAVYAAGAYVFWTNATASTSAIYRGTVGTANSGAVYWSLGTVSPVAIFADPSNVYWTDSNGNVTTCSASTCSSPTTLAAGQPGVYTYGGLAVDAAQMVYWAGYQDSTGVFVRRCPAAGCSAPFEVSSYSSSSMNYQLGGIAVDATYVYWSVWDNGTVYIFKSAK